MYEVQKCKCKRVVNLISVQRRLAETYDHRHKDFYIFLNNVEAKYMPGRKNRPLNYAQLQLLRLHVIYLIAMSLT